VVQPKEGEMDMSGQATALHPVSNDGASTIQMEIPYSVTVTLEGSSAILFHRWSVEGIKEKANSKKGSKAKKSDDLESYVYRCADGTIGIPTEYVRMAIINAAKFRQDPRSPRKSAMDLYKAAIVPLTEIVSTGKPTWDYVDQRRVMIQRNGITRMRPALLAGWRATFDLLVQVPEYVQPSDLFDVLGQAGRLVG
jgi:hypothetical protein